MEKWQVCKVEEETVRRGLSWHYKASALLLTPEGSGPQVIAEIETDPKEVWPVYRMIAKLGLEGWEPMPLYTARDRGMPAEPEVKWWFKRKVEK